MKPIANPYVGRETYHCFACSPDHPFGLRMRFFQDGDEVVCRWQPRAGARRLQRRPARRRADGVLMDEIASWWIFVNRGTAGATARVEVDFKRPVLTAKGEVTLRASLAGTDDHLVTVRVVLTDGAGKLCTEGRVTYFTYPPSLGPETAGLPGSGELCRMSARRRLRRPWPAAASGLAGSPGGPGTRFHARPCGLEHPVDRTDHSQIRFCMQSSRGGRGGSRGGIDGAR